jgi:hypothetical protein
MLKCKQDGDRVLVYSDREDREDLEIIDYCWLTHQLSRIRVVKYLLLPGKTLEELVAVLDQYPLARIRHIMGHEPQFNKRETELILGQLKKPEELANAYRVRIDGYPLIDDFGFHVYIRGEIDFYGNLPDIDLRYND